MNQTQTLARNSSLDSITRRWWFLAIFILLGTVMPPFVSRGIVEPSEIGEVISYILSNALINSWAPWYPVFKIIPLVLVAGIILFGNRMSRVFSLYAGVSYVLFAVLQGIAITDEYGLAIVTGNVITMLIVAGFWFWEAAVGQNDLSPRQIPIAKYWVVPLAFLAFWFPIDLTTMRPEFTLTQFVANSAGLAFCLMTPVYLAILTLYYPKVNMATLRVTSLLGVLIGFWNMVVDILLRLDDPLWWLGGLHIPVLAISIYALILSFHRPGAEE